MAGGTGSRFWPISRTDNPKQFIDVMGIGQSMLQITFNRFSRICPRQNIIIVTGELYVDRVREQLPDLLPYQVLSEPVRRNTAPCIAYAASVIEAINPNANIIVTPSDLAIFGQQRFEDDINQALAITAIHDCIVTIGIPPTNPNEKYGYIQFAEELALPQVGNLHRVITFTEKPPVEMARQFIATGEFLWNSGIFVWKMSTLRTAYQTHLPQLAETLFGITANTDRESLEQAFSQCEAISVDNGIMEKADNVNVLVASFSWSDIETWDTLYDTIHHNSDGNAFIGDNIFTYDTKNTLVVLPSHSDKTVVLEGLDGYIVAATDDTIMVCRRSNEDMVFKFSSDVELKQMMDNK